MNINIQYYGQLAEITGLTNERISIDDSASVSETIEKLKLRHPDIKTVAISAARNSESAGPDTLLSDGDYIDLFPPFAGG